MRTLTAVSRAVAAGKPRRIGRNPDPGRAVYMGTDGAADLAQKSAETGLTIRELLDRLVDDHLDRVAWEILAERVKAAGEKGNMKGGTS